MNFIFVMFINSNQQKFEQNSIKMVIKLILYTQLITKRCANDTTFIFLTKNEHKIYLLITNCNICTLINHIYGFHNYELDPAHCE